MANINQFLDAVTKNGGATYALSTGQLSPERGFFVSLNGTETKCTSEDLPRMTKAFILKHAHLLQKDGMFLGAWKDGEQICLDVSLK